MKLPASLSLLVVTLVCAGAAFAADEPFEATDYSRHIKPVLRERCYACHGALKQKAGLRLDTGKLAREGSEDGAVISPESPEGSALLERITASNESLRMPPIGKPLTAEQIKLFKQWIAAGAPSPEDEQAESDPSEHWAFQVPVRPAVPQAHSPAWPMNPVDNFLMATYERHGLTPAPDASPAHLLRRLHLDLTGLPPTSQQVQSFLSDPSNETCKAVVEALLESPQYGERWGRHWMDIWRYSDWYGRRQQNDVRNSAPQIWRWRDWIVDSLNNDKSYARMIQEMLAADEIASDDGSTWPATGYLIRNYYSLNPNEWMRHNVEYTTKAFLGLTFNCAHCHDHKYDPISHDDYFGMRAFFEPMGVRQDRVAGEPEPPVFQPYTYAGSRKVVRLGMVRIFDEKPDAPTWFYTGGDERNKVQDRGSIPPGVPDFLNVPFRDVAPIDLPITGWYPGSRPEIQQAILEERQAAIAAAEKTLEQASARTIDSAPLEANLRKVRQSFDEAIAAAKAAGEAGALSGRQSLLLDASSGGRQILQQTLASMKSVPDGTTISFRIRVLQDSHVNFQLARDTTKHLTALYVGFVDGKIRSYQPGGFSEFVAGNYDFKAGQNDFAVRLVIQPGSDIALLSVTLADSDTAPVMDVPIALNGWNAAEHPNQPMTFDCRTGTRALLDDVKVVAGEQSFSWDFESPTFADGEDVGGISGWVIHNQSVAPAHSVVSMIAGCESARPSYEALQNATSALSALTLDRDAAELGIKAAELKLQSAQAVIAADRAKHDQADAATIEELSFAANNAQLAADEADAKWRILDAQVKRGRAAALPDADKTKSKQIQDAQTELAAAQKALGAASSNRAKSAGSTDYTRFSPTTSRASTGRRSSLAHWITHDRNPLTPRVAINHIWMRHFHTPLVETVYDFGRNGKPPTHAGLLDWLAVELVENDWSMKHIHRLIVTSRAYRMSSSAVGLDGNLAIDEDNRLLWRMHQGRMESEVVRDSILLIAGKLNSKRGGQPLLNTQAMTTYRRSLYYEFFPEAGGNSELGEIFDPPDPTECFRRTSTVVPQQALALSNSEIIHQSSGDVASRIATNSELPDAEFVSAAFVTVLSRLPNERETEASQRFMKRQRKLLGNDDAVRESLVRVLFNHNDFVAIR